MKPSCIVLLTDFGLSDPYVGAMKGVLAARAPKASVLDLCHGVPPQDVQTAGFILRRCAPFFPDGALFLCVVDPGVGTARRILWARDRKRSYLAPDNGLLDGLDLLETRCVQNRKLFLPVVSSTFHGRDVFAPVAAALARGLKAPALGPRCEPIRAEPRPPGRVVFVDRFGNAVTDIEPGKATGSETVYFKEQRVGILRRSYGEVQPGEPLALIGSFDTVELSIREGDFAAKFGAKPGDKVRLEAPGA